MTFFRLVDNKKKVKLVKRSLRCSHFCLTLRLIT